MNWNWRYNEINSLAPVKFLRETGVSRPGILVVRASAECNFGIGYFLTNFAIYYSNCQQILQILNFVI